MFQGVLSRPINERWGYGFGARLVAPTAGEFPSAAEGGRSCRVWPSPLISRVWRRYVLRAKDAIRSQLCRRSIAAQSLKPGIAQTLNVGLPDRWFVTLYPSYDIRINYGDPVAGQTGRLFLPFDAAIGRITDKVVIVWETAVPIVKDYPVYNFKTELRLTIDF